MIKLRELAEDIVRLMFHTLSMSQLESDVRKSDLAYSMVTAHEHWHRGEWSEVQTACINGIDLCTIWTGRQFSPIPTLLEGILYTLLGSSQILNATMPNGNPRDAVRAFRKSRECLRQMFHASSDRFEAVACLGLAVAFCKDGRYGHAAHACAQGLALLPHEHVVGLGVEELRDKLKTLWMHARALDAAHFQPRTA
ncbi:MAG: hypothetical protein ACT4QE_08290 [Anaerolineales bacterium]